MSIDATAILSQVSGLLGALIGGGASFAVAVYNQRSQERLQRVANEVTKREAIYADFLVNASKLLLNAYTLDDLVLGGDEQHLIGLINRMRLFAPPHIVGEAEAVLKAIVEVLLKPSIELRQLARGIVVQESRSRPLSEVQPELPGRPGLCAPHLEVTPMNDIQSSASRQVSFGPFRTFTRIVPKPSLSVGSQRRSLHHPGPVEPGTPKRDACLAHKGPPRAAAFTARDLQTLLGGLVWNSLPRLTRELRSR